MEGFDLHTPLYESARVAVTRGTRLADDAPVVVKRLMPAADTPRNRARLAGEHRILQRLSQENAACVLRPLELWEAPGGMALVSHDMGGASLRRLIELQPLPVVEALAVALEVCRALADLRTLGLVHKQLSPDAIVYNRETAQVQLVDFSLVADEASGVPALESLLSREAQAQYMSPEQTGRLNRPVDARSDHYSLGVTLYELLTQEQPFAHGDVTQLLYQILATVPPHVSDLMPRIPAPVGDIVRKLLEKIPEQRYQSAQGIAHDVSQCLQQLSIDGRVKSFHLGTEDRSMRLEAPRRLYGRDRELEVLEQAYSRVLIGKAAEVVVVRGASGIGKSALVAEFAHLEGLGDALFAVAKHEEARAHVPFAGLREAMGQIVRQLLSEPPDAVAQWRQHLRASVAASGQPLVQMVPSLELLLGTPAPASAVDTIENEHRLLLAWRRLFEVLTARRPVVLFLDDLQWADGGALRLLSSMFRDGPRASGLLLVVALREAEGAGQPDVLRIAGLQSAEAPCKEVRLHPLTRAAVQELLEGATQRSGEATRSLAEWLHRLTGGNPFFVRESLKHLSRKQLITYRIDEGRWAWNLVEIAAAQVPDDVAALLLERLLALEPAQRRLLGYAACLGNEISLELLRSVCTLARAEALVRLGAAVESGILVAAPGAPSQDARAPHDVVYRFAHDRIRQAAHDLLRADEALAFHYSVARYYLDSLDLDRPEAWVFMVIGHVNAARPLVRDPEELRLHARLNAVAARAAKNAATYSAAVRHIDQALGCLSDRPWETDYPLMLQLALERIELEFLMADVDGANAHIQEALDHVRTPEERAEVLRLRVICLAEANQYEQALATGGAALAALGFAWGEVVPSRRAAAWALGRARLAMGWHDARSLTSLPRLEDARLLCALRILDGMVVPAFYTHARALAVICATLVRLTLAHGTSPYGAFGFASLATYWGRANRFDRARQCAAAAQSLLQQQQGSWQRSKTLFAINLFVDVLRHHPTEQNLYADTLQEMLLQDGALVYAGLNLIGQVQGLTMLSLSETLEKINHYKSFVHGRNTPRLVGWLAALRQTCLCLQGLTVHPGSFTTTDYNEEMEASRARQEPGNPRSLGFWYGKVLTLWVHRQPAAARNAVVEAVRAGVVERSSPQALAYVSYFMCLALIDHARQLGLRKMLDRAVFAGCLRRLRAVAQAGPEILAGLPRLIDAEQAALGGQQARALTLFETALPELERSGYTAAAAAGYEAAGRFYTARGMRERSVTCLQRARALYQQWGAWVKVQLLDDELNALFNVVPVMASAAHAPHPQRSPLAMGRAERVDVPALVEATQALLELDDAKGRFFDNITLALRTPLTLILGPLEALLAGPVSAAERQQLQLCLRNGLRLLGMVDDLLALASAPGTAAEGGAAPVLDVLDRLRGLVDLARPWAQRKQIQLVSEMPVQGEALAQIAPQELESMVLHLLGNAVKFTPQDGRVVMRLTSTDTELTLRISDTGVGIAPEHLPKLFGRQHSGGVGLGLAVCKKILAQRGGSMTAESAVGQGTSVTVCLPRLREGDAVRSTSPGLGQQGLRAADDYRLRPFGDIALHEPVTPPVQGHVGNALLLVVDDNPDMVAFVTAVLRDEYEVCVATDGLQGLHVARGLRPDLLLTDVSMAGLDGVALAQRLRADRQTAHIPIVVLTAQGDGPDGATADAVLSKPFAPEELRGAVRQVLKQRAQHTANHDLRSHDLRRVVAGVSHEVLNPLGFIRSAVYLLREAGLEAAPDASPLQDRILEAARAAEEGVHRVRHAVDELRRFGGGGPQTPPVRLPMGGIVENIQRLAGHDLRLALELSAVRPVWARAGQLEQVLLNLVLNAQRAAGPSGTIRLRTWDEGDSVCLSVSDDGPGVDLRNLERIFQPFFTTRADGAGLGLAISRQIVREHGGDLRANSEPGQGSTFTLRLPAAVDD